MRRNICYKSVIFSLTAMVWMLAVVKTDAHPRSMHRFLRSRRAAQARENASTISVKQADGKKGAGEKTPAKTCRLTVELIDAASGKPIHGLLRVTAMKVGKQVKLDDYIKRDANWYAVTPKATLTLPQGKMKIEALHGLETELATKEIDLTGKDTAAVKLSLKRFYDARQRGLRGGNTHLHLMRLTHAEAYRYLQIVPKADDLDLVFLSVLRRLPDERHYISNKFTQADLARLSLEGVRFGNGQEHRHNFTGYGEGYGHVMFLNILKLIRPVSIGPGIMKSGTDGIPLQRGIKQAHRDGATVIWCHNTYGMEDLPNWAAGLLDAQNIFDGGTHGSYKDTFYKYLNLGMKVPFSTGTDWFIYDFSRVYVPQSGKMTVKSWLTALSEGRTFITNGPFLEFTAGGKQIGDTILLDKAGHIEIDGRALGRADFGKIELIHNGRVVKTIPAQREAGHHRADMKFSLPVDGPGWVTLRVAVNAGKNEFDRSLYAHTSPIYIEMAGRKIFQAEIAEQFITEIQKNIEVIRTKGKFANDAERESVLKVHRQGIEHLKQRITEAKKSN